MRRAHARCVATEGASVATGEKRTRRVGFSIKMLVMVAALVVVYLYSFIIGSVDISVGTVIDILRAQIMPVEQ